MITEFTEAFCCECGVTRTWKRRRSHDQCTSCGTLFPCKHKCRHADCREQRGELKADAQGILRPLCGLPEPTLAQQAADVSR